MEEGKASGSVPAGWELNPSKLQAKLSMFNIDMWKAVAEMEKEFAEIRAQRPRGYFPEMRSEVKRLQTFDSLRSYSSWSPEEMSQSGFYHTGLKDSVQCFCCGLVVCTQSLNESPSDSHRKFSPDCDFLRGGEAGNIPQYEVKVRGKGPAPPGGAEQYESESGRLETFQNWPFYASVAPRDLASAGFFFTGQTDVVQCFCCAGLLAHWETGDEPWKEHAKWFPDCEFVHEKKSSQEISEYIRSYEGFCGITAQHYSSEGWTDMETMQSPDGQDSNLDENNWLAAARRLSVWLKETYSSLDFRRILSIPETVPTALDLQSTFAWLPLVSKNTRNEPVQHMCLPALLRHLSHITAIEGEVGSGKTALLKKIALLWASGDCPVLHRFRLVFFLSLKSVDGQQGLADVISEQLCGAGRRLDEEAVRSMVYTLREQLLFLIDDDGAAGTLPACLKELIFKNHLSKTSIVMGLQTNRTARVRQLASAVLEIRQFPIYSTTFLLKRLFSHNPTLVEKVFLQLGLSEELRGLFKTPLFAVALCSALVRDPEAPLERSAVFRAYLDCVIQSRGLGPEVVTAAVASCGELALAGLFEEQFEFADTELAAAGVDGQAALSLGLLSKFTAQVLRPVYRFFHLSFQEFLAAKRLSALLESDSEALRDRGRCYLRQVDTCFRVLLDHRFFLLYACSCSAAAAAAIVAHLFDIAGQEGFLHSRSQSSRLLELHPELLVNEQALRVCVQLDLGVDIWLHQFLELAIQAAFLGRSVPACAPLILAFLSGRCLSFESRGGKSSVHHFVELYPQALSLLNCITISAVGSRKGRELDFLKTGEAFKFHGQPVVEEEYASAFQLLSDVEKKTSAEQENIHQFNMKTLRHFNEATVSTLLLAGKSHALPLLKLSVLDLERLEDQDQRSLEAILSVCNKVDLDVTNSDGFLESLLPVFQQSRSVFRGIRYSGTRLSEVEEDLVLSMSALESLDLTFKVTPESLLANLDKLPCLTELNIASQTSGVFEKITDGFGSLQSMEKLTLGLADLTEDNKIAWFLQHFPRLKVFGLKSAHCRCFPELATAIASCQTLEQISFEDFPEFNCGASAFAAALPCFQQLKGLDLHSQRIEGPAAAQEFARALGSLAHLERLQLPGGTGMKAAISTVLAQLPRLPRLAHLSAPLLLEDRSLQQLANCASEGHLQAIETLDLNVNHHVTDAGWRGFFLGLDRVPRLKALHMSRLYSSSLKPHASTVRAFVQCVARLPALTTIVMYGWLLDAQDFAMFDQMKARHPQAKCLNISWQWALPFAPLVQAEAE
nr:PREDICTED: baculoviral IAP repeat-containing protein 1b-like [Lepisosteus oculatus]XP_015216447.1 PREDICTED: baculoviral IAP repeat-containing protein 1b-like [Lepisosteus oculatus]XP_015216453.1 PREDICTED: baculoviral IAP repeat-containing protein 1b-like [Lepisosteus oculatus]